MTYEMELTPFEKEIYNHLTQISDIIDSELIKFKDLNENDAQIHVKEVLEYVTNHMAAFLASIAFGILTDPENWLKHTFYETLKHVQYRRKDAMNAAAQLEEKSETPH